MIERLLNSSAIIQGEFAMKDMLDSIDPGRSNGVPHISTKQLEMLPFPLLSHREQKQIEVKVDELVALCDQLKTQLSDAQTTQLHLADAIVEQAVG